MPTRGVIGFVYNGEQKITYVPFDAYPSRCGVQNVEFLRSGMAASGNDTASLIRKFQDLHLVTRGKAGMPVPMETANKVRYVLQDQSLPADSWYNLLRTTQGDLGWITTAGAMIDAASFGEDSLHCEWGWIVDLNTETLDVYRGFQREPHEGGLWSGVPEQRGGYYGIRKIQGFYLDALPTRMDLQNMERLDNGLSVAVK